MKKDYDNQTESKKRFFVSQVESWLYQCQWLFLPLIITVFIMTNYTATAQLVYQGVVPVENPSGGFGVDGDAFSNTPTPNYLDVGDWFNDYISYPGTGGSLLDEFGEPIDPNMTTFYRDSLSGDPDFTIFLEKAKINEHPNTYTWGEGNVPNKNEIQNVGIHFSWGDPTVMGYSDGSPVGYGDPNDLWCLFAADREVTNGSSYIDFEFLQKTLTTSPI